MGRHDEMSPSDVLVRTVDTGELRLHGRLYELGRGASVAASPGQYSTPHLLTYRHLFMRQELQCMRAV